jgi:hypothetical protein
VSADVSEEHIASILRGEEISSARNQRASWHLLSRWFLAELISSTLKMEAICSSETSVETQRPTRRYILEVGTLQLVLFGIKSFLFMYVFI